LPFAANTSHLPQPSSALFPPFTQAVSTTSFPFLNCDRESKHSLAPPMLPLL